MHVHLNEQLSYLMNDHSSAYLYTYSNEIFKIIHEHSLENEKWPLAI